MRTFIALAILAVVAVCVNSEGCRSDSDCENGLTMCAPNHALTCHNRACYCEAQTTNTGSGCSDKSDCPSSANCHSGRGNYHCVDAKCRCFYF
ncbi:serine protease inhibitor Cvsi-2-like [Mizuhopecten yessoensis]|uniref:Serine protease inhibitor Cvsi-2 n=1 Tax=Mizuhopecten yessoensis TaxID=6573 RepID=A0A210QMV1_MIZYE|nr:serine protease inhibitor Cvsi-2-like [Mizuhopecten yessoensis]OWF50057.1 Serine protease inhibitor Cvsi-2 [Mizuhopecten yessoensis]